MIHWLNVTDEVHLTHSGNLRGPVGYSTIGLWWSNIKAYSNETALLKSGVISITDPPDRSDYLQRDIINIINTWVFRVAILNFHFITSIQGQGGHKWEDDNEPGHSSIDIKTHS